MRLFRVFESILFIASCLAPLSRSPRAAYIIINLLFSLDLADDDEHIEKQGGGNSMQHASDRRQTAPVVGIRNETGAQCYLNAIIQLIATSNSASEEATQDAGADWVTGTIHQQIADAEEAPRRSDKLAISITDLRRQWHERAGRVSVHVSEPQRH